MRIIATSTGSNTVDILVSDGGCIEIVVGCEVAAIDYVEASQLFRAALSAMKEVK